MRFLYIVLIIILFCNGLSAQDIKINGIPRDTSFTVHSAFVKEKKYRDYIEIVKPKLPDNVIAKEQIIYSNPGKDRNLHLNLYRPDDSKKYPALLMVHGGGWSSGDLSLQIPMAQQIASKGYVTIPVEYRLSPEALYPTAVYDLKTAVRWIRANAEKYGVDTTKIAISGCSAGGQLANLIGATNGQAEYEGDGEYNNYSSTVHAVINIDGISDFTTAESLENVSKSLAKGKTPASVRWFGGTIDKQKNLWLAASPLFHVTPRSASICFINSSIPRFHDGRDEMIEKLNEYNIYTEVHTIEDTPHPFWLFHPWFETTVKYMTDYLDKMFK